VNISEGPLMRKYAEAYGCEAGDVVAWINGYVNGPWDERLKDVIESTEQERFDAIRGYIDGMVKEAQ
jgi:hypothetical protein